MRVRICDEKCAMGVFEVIEFRFLPEKNVIRMCLSDNRNIYIRGKNAPINQEQYNEVAEILAREGVAALDKDVYIMCAPPAETKIFWQRHFPGNKGTIRVINKDLCSVKKPYDVVVCSAFKKSYEKRTHTLIGELYEKAGISVEALAKAPEMRTEDGCWLSANTGKGFRRIACMELLALGEKITPEVENRVINTFKKLKGLLAQAAEKHIPVKRIAMPFLGTGNQGIERYYMASTMMKHCLSMIEELDIEQIDIYEIDTEKCQYLSNTYRDWFEKDKPEVFISYSSKNSEMAENIYRMLTSKGYYSWKAPESIPSGADYAEEIAQALGQTRVVVWLMTPESLKSVWVRKEIGVAFSNGCHVIPCRMNDVKPTGAFGFMLEGTQAVDCFDGNMESKIQTELGRYLGVRENLQL